MGGGTPSLLGPERISQILNTLQQYFVIAEDPEITMEITPGSVSSDDMDHYVDIGVNRLSIGAQSFVDTELRAVGRLHDSRDTVKTVGYARRAGIENFNLDVIVGLPHQTLESLNLTFNQLLDLYPAHVSLYLFEIDTKSRLGAESLLDGSRYHAKSIPAEEVFVKAYREGQERLLKANFEHYEISNFAVPGFRSRHNMKYWCREPYIGFGSGAHSFDGVARWSNEVTPKDYVEKSSCGKPPRVEFHIVNREQALEESLFLGLRKLEGVSLKAIKEQFGIDLTRYFQNTLEELQACAMVEMEGDQLRLTDQALLISNEIFQEFIAPSSRQFVD